MIKRTWPYGTKLKAKIIRLSPKNKSVSLVDEHREGHIIIGADHEIRPSLGDKVIICFTEGGPNGGYWKMIGFQDEAKDANGN